MATVSIEMILFLEGGGIGIAGSSSSSVLGVTSTSLQAAVNNVTRMANRNGSFLNFCILLVFKVDLNGLSSPC